MNINNTNYINSSHRNFNGNFVSVSEQHLGREIVTNVINVFNRKLLPQMSVKTSPLANDVNFFTLAGGAGSRFKISRLIGNYTKVNMPLTPDSDTLHLLDFSLQLGSPYITKEGVVPFWQKEAKGSLSGIVDYYLSGNPIKDTFVCCADSVFGSDKNRLLKFLNNCVKDKNTHLSIIGGQRPSQEVANKYGIITTQKSGAEHILNKIIEKPELEVAKQHATDGLNITSTGLFYISKEAIGKLLGEIKKGLNPIKKNDKEIYDFGLAIKYIFSQYQNWFGKITNPKAKVKISPTWQDVGETKGFYQLVQGIIDGQYLHGFPKELSEKIRRSLTQRANFKASQPYINFAKSESVLPEQISNAVSVDNVKIII